MPGEPMTTNNSDHQHAPDAHLGDDFVSVTLSDGTLYDGPLLDGKPEGHGVCTFASGTICVGDFHNGCVQGHADVLFPSGVLFSGSFCNSLADGAGHYMRDGALVCGTWRGGVLAERAGEKTNGGSGNERTKLFTHVARHLGDQLRRLTTATRATNRRHLRAATKIAEPKVILADHDDNPPASGNTSCEVQETVMPILQTTRAPSLAMTFAEATAAGQQQGPFPGMDASFASATTRRRATLGGTLLQGKRSSRHAAPMNASPNCIVACAAPASNEFFSFSRYTKFCFIFLFPFWSLPCLPFSPIHSARLEMEREFVVSGASLLREFDPPIFSLYFTTLAMCCHIAAIVIVAAKVALGSASSGQITLAEVAIPCVFWVVQGLFSAGYNSYMRMAHALERLERRLTPQLTAFAAGLVDTKAKVCIYTWNEKGRSMVTNKHYRYRWLACSTVVGIVMSFAAPLTRVGFHHTLFGKGKYEIAAGVLIFFSNLMFSTIFAYYILKITDMQRQILEQMRVMTRLAYLEDRSLMRPSEYLKQRFNFEELINIEDVFSGVVGWCVIRSLVLCASTCSNHAARSTSMSIFLTFTLCGFFVIIGDVVYMAAAGDFNSGTYYSARHTYALILCTFWGFILLRYLYICVETAEEYRHHLYLLDVASLYHRLEQGTGDKGSEVIAKCRQMIKEHGELPSFFSVRISSLMLVLIVFLHMLAVVAIAVILYITIKNR